MTKVTIVGAGNAGCFTALEYSWLAKIDKWVTLGSGVDEIELIYDPDSESEKVGQATFPPQPQLLWSALEQEFNYYSNKINATPKLGILYQNWGKTNKDIFHPFPGNHIAVHFCPWEMQSFVLNSNSFKVKRQKVNDISNIDSDYIVDCRGKPSSFEDYDPLINPINAAVLGKPNEPNTDPFTKHIATEDGWTFVIPTDKTSPSYSRSVGYLYNKDITSREDAEKNFTKNFDVTVTDNLTFNSYVAKNPVIDNRIILNGNRLFFLEPMESTSISTYQTWAKLSYQFVGNKGWAPHHAVIDIKRHIQQVQNFILWHYKFGSQYDTPFWKYAEGLTLADPEFTDALHFAKNQSLETIKIAEAAYPSTYKYGPWSISSFKYWLKGMNEKLYQRH